MPFGNLSHRPQRVLAFRFSESAFLLLERFKIAENVSREDALRRRSSWRLMKHHRTGGKNPENPTYLYTGAGAIAVSMPPLKLKE
jgi:hypothetical protein